MRLVHPAILSLQRFQANSTLRRVKRAFSTRRRSILSVVGIALAVVFLSNSVVSVIYRESLDPRRFQDTVPFALLTYSLWHVVRTAFKRPLVGMEWSPAEIEWVCAAPFSYRDQLIYRFASIMNAAVIKAIFFAFLMWPDLRQPWAGFTGLLLALLFIEFWRIGIEIMAWGMPERAYRFYRCATAALVVTFTMSVIVIGLCQPASWRFGSAHASLGLLRHLFDAAISMRSSLAIQALESPLHIFAEVIASESHIVASLAAAIAINVGMVWCVVQADRFFFELKMDQERRRYSERCEDLCITEESRDPLGPAISLPRIPFSGWPSVPLAWRQIQGANHYRASILFPLSVTGVLACLPVFVYRNPHHTLLNVAGALAFYSFLLLPTILKFDFRRDLDRLVILKSLPLRPLSIVIGQLAAPIGLATMYQMSVLLVVAVVRPIPWHLSAASLLLFVPLNALIFAIENLFFLWYPYRVQQEGILIFLRTVLTFTAKGLLFGATMLVTVLWTFGAGAVSHGIAYCGVRMDHRLIFAVGMWVILVASCVAAIYALARAFDRFDVSQDMPA
jgi:hypothetical protein